MTPEFCTGGQPRLEHFAKLKADGVKAVLNLRQPSEHRADEEQQAVEAAGLKYFNIPVNYQNPSDADVDQFLKITDDPANRPMFIHCTAAIRVGAFWMIRRVLRDGMTIDAALEEAKKVGLPRRAASRAVRARYIARTEYVHRRCTREISVEPLSNSEAIQVARLQEQALTGGRGSPPRLDPRLVAERALLVERAVADIDDGARPQVVGAEEIGEHPVPLAVVTARSTGPPAPW